jgi:hypothetical protein
VGLVVWWVVSVFFVRFFIFVFVVCGVVLCLVRVFTVVPGNLPSIRVALTL